jgi:transcriptional regulator with XRE-family HTH domain
MLAYSARCVSNVSGAREEMSPVMTGEEPSSKPGIVAQRLEHLFQTVHPRDREPYSNRDVAEEINRRAGTHVISATYLWQLRTGKRDDPTHSRLSAVADFFGVSPMYFYDDAVAERADEQMELLSVLRDEGVRHMALRADGLSAKSLAAITRMIEHSRELEGLPTEDG